MRSANARAFLAVQKRFGSLLLTTISGPCRVQTIRQSNAMNCAKPDEDRAARKHVQGTGKSKVKFVGPVCAHRPVAAGPISRP